MRSIDKFRSMAADEIERFRREIVERTGDARAGRQHHRPGPAPRGHEHGRQAGPARRLDPLRRVGLDADRGLGRQHRHARPGRPRLRHAAPVRTGHRPRAAPAVLRAQRGAAVRRRVRRHLRHSVRLHGQAGRRAAAAAARDRSGQGGPPRARSSGDPFPARRGLSRRAARGATEREFQRRIDARADARSGRAIDHAEFRHHRRGRRTESRRISATCGRRRCCSTSRSDCSTRSGAIRARSRKLHLFGQLKRITKQWLETCLVCKGGTYPAQLMYQDAGRHGLRTASPRPSPRSSWARSRSRRCSIPTTRPARRGTCASTPRAQTLGDRARSRCHVNWVDARQRLGGGVLPRRRGASQGASPT